MRPKIITDDFDLAPYLPIGVIGDTNSARLSNTLQPRGDIDAVAENIVVVKNDVTDVDADPEIDAVLWEIHILTGHAALNLNRAASGIHRAGELHQQPVTGGLDDAAAMSGDGGVDHGISDNL